MALANAKLGAVHGFAGVIGGRTAAAHGAICAAMLAPVVEGNVAALRAMPDGTAALERYRTVARLLTGDAETDVADGVAWLRQTVAELGVPGLSGLGVRASDADEIVTAAAAASSMRGNPVQLDHAQLRAILAAAG
jgi:alcohol dehydrogenase class IV